MNYNKLEGLTNSELLELYDNVVDFGYDNYLSYRYICYVTCNCTNGRRSYNASGTMYTCCDYTGLSQGYNGLWCNPDAEYYFSGGCSRGHSHTASYTIRCDWH